MPFVPSEAEEAFWFALAPVTTLPTALYSLTGYVTGDYPYGKPDLASSARNAMGWGAIAASVYGWNLMMSPHNAVWVSGTQAFKVAGHFLMSPAMIPVAAVAIAVAAGAGYVSTSDVHGGAVPGVTSFGGVGPGHYQDSSDPMQEFEEGVAGFWARLGF